MSRTSPPSLLLPQLSQLVVIDVQEKLLPAICEPHKLTTAIRFLMDAAAILQISAVITEQYPKGLGPTVAPLRQHAATIRTLEKIQFSAAQTLINGAWAAETSETAVPVPGPSQIVLVGIETHVCVQQTALELCQQGFQVFVAADCVGSRFPDDHQWGLHRMAQAGVIVTTAEAIAFEWCGRAGTDRFKALSGLIRSRDTQRQV
jgi:nicotinamidase-related amidase